MSQALTVTSLIGKPMATAPTQKTFTTIERTYRANIELPRSGGYALHIHRQKIYTDSGVEVAVIDDNFRYNEPIAKMFTRPSGEALIAACQNVKTPADFMAMLRDLFDSLIVEIDTEKAKG